MSIDGDEDSSDNTHAQPAAIADSEQEDGKCAEFHVTEPIAEDPSSSGSVAADA